LSDDELLATLTQSSSGPGPRAAAALALATRRADPAIASELRRAATDRHRLVRASALHALCALRPPDESGIELAARALYEPDEQLSQAALASLALSASPTEASRPLLESTLSADQLNER